MTEISERPQASRLARLLAANQVHVPNLRHRLIALSPPARVVISLLDGTRTVAQIGSEAGRLAVAEGQTMTEDNVRQVLVELGRSALLEA
jgi:hypothetical protein